MKIAIAFTVGILVWQMLVTLHYIIFQNEENSTIFGMGFPGLVCTCICSFIAYLKRKNRSRKYKALMVDPNGVLCYCNSHTEPEWLAEIGYHFPKTLNSKYSIKDGWDERNCVGDIPNFRYTPFAIIKAEGAYEVSKATLVEAKRKILAETKRKIDELDI